MATGGTAAIRAALRAAALACDPSREELAAVARYQAHDGTHEKLSSLLRGRHASPAEARRLRSVLRGLDSLLARAVLPVDVTVYKGVPDITALLEPGEDLPVSIHQGAYLSTSLDRTVAERDFMGAAPGAALLAITAPAGTSALWMPPVGERDYAYGVGGPVPSGVAANVHRPARRWAYCRVSCEVVW